MIKNNKKDCIIIAGGSWGFPKGMAASRRVGLLGRALKLAGFRVEVIQTTTSERQDNVINKDPRGIYRGVHFRYSSGTTVASKYFIIRRLIQFKGYLCTTIHLSAIAKKYNVKGVLIYSRTLFDLIVITLTSKIIGIPVCIELNEWPPARKRMSIFNKNKAKLVCWLIPNIADNMLVISDYIKNKAVSINPGIENKIFKIPILTDPDIDDHKGTNDDISVKKKILFSGSLDYVDTIIFLLKVLKIVIVKDAAVQLNITGKGSNNTAKSEIISYIKKEKLCDHVVLHGYISEEKLKELQFSCICHLAPLENDEQSKARMPTKIAEYLLTGKPVITSKVGEIASFLINDVNSYVCPPDDIETFSEAILKIASGTSHASIIGEQGRKLALESFNYKNYSGLLGKIFK